MLERFCMAQNFRALIAGNMPESLDDLREAFLDVFDDEKRGSLINDILAFDDTSVAYGNINTLSELDEATYTMLAAMPELPLTPPWYAYQQQNITYRGVNFSVHRHSPGNSYVIHGDIGPGRWKAARIVQIVIQLQEETGSADGLDTVVLVVENFDSLNVQDAENDPYRLFPSSGIVGRMFYNTASDVQMLAIPDIVCHFAHTVIDDFDAIPKECIHALPLDRVCILQNEIVDETTN